MLNLTFRLFFAALILFIPFQSYSAGIISAEIRKLDNIRLEADAALNQANKNLEQTIPSQRTIEDSGNQEAIRVFNRLSKSDRNIIDKAIISAKLEARKNVSEASKSVKHAKTQLDKITSDLNRIEEIGSTIEKEKAEVERNAQLLSFGFFTSLITTMIAIFGFLINLPTIFLDRQLKKLEIEEKKALLANGS